MQLTKVPRFVYRKGGTFYFSRRVPSDLQRRLGTACLHAVSLVARLSACLGLLGRYSIS